MKAKTPLSDADSFCDGSVYRLPFVCFDPTPGGSNLGRIEWHIEPLPKGSRIGAVLVWASQTRDKRYAGKVFTIPCLTSALTTNRYEGNDYFAFVWHAAFCREHKALSFSAYPDDKHTELIIECMSSIGNRVYFR